MRKIRFTCDWCDDTALTKRLERCYISKKINVNFESTIEEDYDILVSINKPITEVKNPNVKYIGVLMEPSWFLGEYKKGEIYRTCDYVISYNQNSPFSNNIYYPGVLPFQLTYEDGPGLDFYLENNNTDKPKLCSMIVSREKTAHSEEIHYNSRIRAAEEILKTDLPIDIFGKGWDNLIGTDKRIKGSLGLEDKHKGLTDYKFSICVENCSEGSYFTEKITDSLLVNTIPIYYGCKNILNFFKSPIVLPTLKMPDVITLISDVLKNKSQKIFHIEDKTLIANKFNLFVALNKLILKM